MTEPPALAHPALDHIEKALADSYCKEIDQEENIWRSLPFFAATLALQLAALFQVIERLPPDQTWAFIPSRLLAATSFGCSLGALGLLTASIWKARFRYVARDDDLLGYALGLIEDERAPDQAQAVPVSVVHILKEDLARQYDTATDHNRAINKRREWFTMREEPKTVEQFRMADHKQG